MTTLDEKIEKIIEEYYEIWLKEKDLCHIQHDIANLIRSSIRKAVKESLKEEKELCKKIFINEVDWGEWAISDEEAGEDFENYHKKYLKEGK